MKNIKSIITGAAILALFVTACDDNLSEKPRHIYEPGYFQTEEGIQGGLTSLYAHTRLIYGQYYYAAIQNGTDESTYAQSADNNFKDSDMSGVGSLTASSSRSDVLWNSAFSNINTASGIIENADAVGLSEALVSEARFFRAWDYFMLVQTFGGVPLDLGSGEMNNPGAEPRGIMLLGQREKVGHHAISCTQYFSPDLKRISLLHPYYHKNLRYSHNSRLSRNYRPTVDSLLKGK